MIRDSGISGNGSLYASRFGAGDVISASQLNDLNSGLMQGTVQPYLGAGVVTAYGAGGTQVLYNPDLPPDLFIPYQFQVIITKVGTDFQATIQRGYVVAQGMDASIDSSEGILNKLVLKSVYNGTYFANSVAFYASGKMTTGTDTESGLMNDGGYYTMPTGGTVYFSVVRNCFDPLVNHPPAGWVNSWPYVGITIAGDDADVKTLPPNELDYAPRNGLDLQKYFQQIVNGNTEVDVYEPGSETPTVYNIPTAGGTSIPDLRLVNYNWSRTTFAKAVWNGESWDVTQYTYGPIVMPVSFVFDGVKSYNSFSDPPPTPVSPDYADEQENWFGVYTGYDKAYTSATEPVDPAP